MPLLSSLTNPSSKVLSATNSMSSASNLRPAYAIPSHNQNNGWYGTIFLDEEFNQMYYSTAGSYYGTTGNFYQLNESYANRDFVFQSNSNTAGNQSSSSGFYLSGMWNGQYGCMITKPTSRGIITGHANTWPTTDINVFCNEAYTYVNSDHFRRDLTVQLRNGILTTSSIQRPWSGRWGQTVLPETMRKYFDISSYFPSGTQITNMWGSASYNAVRKELVVMANNSNASGRFDIAIWKNVDWNANNCDVTQLGAPTNTFNFVSPNWNQNNDESRFCVKPILVDNGDIYYSVFFQSDNFSLFKITRDAGDVSGTSTRLEARGVTTSYGRDQGQAYSQRIISTRIGNMVAVACPYYYYASGMRSFVIDKRNSSYVIGYENSDGSFGSNMLKYKDDSFAFIHGNNYYAGNYSAISNIAFISPRAGTTPGYSNHGTYMPLAPGPNTTNYIGVYNVFDYDIQVTAPSYSGGKR